MPAGDVAWLGGRLAAGLQERSTFFFSHIPRADDTVAGSEL